MATREASLLTQAEADRLWALEQKRLQGVKNLLWVPLGKTRGLLGKAGAIQARVRFAYNHGHLPPDQKAALERQIDEMLEDMIAIQEAVRKL